MCETSDVRSIEDQRQRIRELNDQLRRTFMGGRIMLTAGFSELPNLTKARALAAIRSYDDFDESSDPYGEHDFGSVTIDGQDVWFKVDCDDKSLAFGSPDPANPDLTTRVLTILLPEDY